MIRGSDSKISQTREPASVPDGEKPRRDAGAFYTRGNASDETEAQARGDRSLPPYLRYNPLYGKTDLRYDPFAYPKEALYEKVGVLRDGLGLDGHLLPHYFSVVRAIRSQRDLMITGQYFSTEKIRGFSKIEYKYGYALIVLNRRMKPESRAFDLCHEFMHVRLHWAFMPENELTAAGTDGVTRDPVMEWEGNEGAAELLLPYGPFLRAVAPYFRAGTGTDSVKRAIEAVSERTGLGAAGEAIVRNRLYGLSYELQQYLDGVPEDGIRLMTAAGCRKCGVMPETPEAAAARFGWNNTHVASDVPYGPNLSYINYHRGR